MSRSKRQRPDSTGTGDASGSDQDSLIWFVGEDIHISLNMDSADRPPMSALQNRLYEDKRKQFETQTREHLQNAQLALHEAPGEHPLRMFVRISDECIQLDLVAAPPGKPWGSKDIKVSAKIDFSVLPTDLLREYASLYRAMLKNGSAKAYGNNEERSADRVCTDMHSQLAGILVAQMPQTIAVANPSGLLMAFRDMFSIWFHFRPRTTVAAARPTKPGGMENG